MHFGITFPKARRAGLKFCKVGTELQKPYVTWTTQPCVRWEDIRMLWKFTGQRGAVEYDWEVRPQVPEGAVYVLRDRYGNSTGVSVSCGLAV